MGPRFKVPDSSGRVSTLGTESEFSVSLTSSFRELFSSASRLLFSSLFHNELDVGEDAVCIQFS